MQRLCFRVPTWLQAAGQYAPPDALPHSISLGTGDAWPCYWRPFLIAAAVHCAEQLPAEVKTPVQHALLRCAPLGRSQPPPCDAAALAEHRAELELAGVDFVADLALLHGPRSSRPLGDRLIRLSAAQMQALQPHLPRCVEALPAPWAAQPAYHDLADQRWDELIAAFAAWAAAPSLAQARVE